MYAQQIYWWKQSNYIDSDQQTEVFHQFWWSSSSSASTANHYQKDSDMPPKHPRLVSKDVPRRHNMWGALVVAHRPTIPWMVAEKDGQWIIFLEPDGWYCAWLCMYYFLTLATLAQRLKLWFWLDGFNRHTMDTTFAPDTMRSFLWN